MTAAIHYMTPQQEIADLKARLRAALTAEEDAVDALFAAEAAMSRIAVLATRMTTTTTTANTLEQLKEIIRIVKQPRGERCITQ